MSAKHYEIDDPKFGKVQVIEGEHSVAMTSGKFGGWLKTKQGEYISVEAAKRMNRAQRRKRGIKLPH